MLEAKRAAQIRSMQHSTEALYHSLPRRLSRSLDALERCSVSIRSYIDVASVNYGSSRVRGLLRILVPFAATLLLNRDAVRLLVCTASSALLLVSILDGLICLSGASMKGTWL
jgi:hypothetical protein